MEYNNVKEIVTENTNLLHIYHGSKRMEILQRRHIYKAIYIIWQLFLSQNRNVIHFPFH